MVFSGFGGTDSITIQLDKSSHVVALQFVYPNSSSYSSLVDSYLAVLGQPASRMDADSAQGRIERAVWLDSLTRFELQRFSRGDTTFSLTSLLANRSPTQVGPATPGGAGFTPGMSRVGDCWDNAMVESFFATLTKERLAEGMFEPRAIAAHPSKVLDSLADRSIHVSVATPTAAPKTHPGPAEAFVAGCSSMIRPYFPE
jgi:transposase InsO family protein